MGLGQASKLRWIDLERGLQHDLFMAWTTDKVYGNQIVYCYLISRFSRL